MATERFLLTLILVSILVACEAKEKIYTEKTENFFLKEYSGSYSIEISDLKQSNEKEHLVLGEIGDAKWMLIIYDNMGDSKIFSEKTGYWEASNQKITVTLSGESGPIVESFSIKNEIFLSDLFNSRSL